MVEREGEEKQKDEKGMKEKGRERKGKKNGKEEKEINQMKGDPGNVMESSKSQRKTAGDDEKGKGR